MSDGTVQVQATATPASGFDWKSVGVITAVITAVVAAAVSWGTAQQTISAHVDDRRQHVNSELVMFRLDRIERKLDALGESVGHLHEREIVEDENGRRAGAGGT